MTPASFLPRAVRQLGLFGTLAVVGCHNLDGFTTREGEAYCGPIAGAKFQTGFVPTGQPPDLTVALRLNAGKLTTQPGFLSSHNAATSLCGEQPLFQDAPLRPIPVIDSDAISTLSFGEGHEHDFFAYVDSTCQGTMLAVVSLMKNNLVELRLFKPARFLPPDPVPAPEEQAGFAVFHLQVAKRGTDPEDSCGF